MTIFAAFLRVGFAADVSEEDQAKLSSLQQKIDESDEAALRITKLAGISRGES